MQVLGQEIEDALEQCFSTPNPRTQMIPRKVLDESASTVAFASSQFILYYK